MTAHDTHDLDFFLSFLLFAMVQRSAHHHTNARKKTTQLKGTEHNHILLVRSTSDFPQQKNTNKSQNNVVVELRKSLVAHLRHTNDHCGVTSMGDSCVYHHPWHRTPDHTRAQAL